MVHDRVQDIRKAKKEAQLLKELSNFFFRIVLDDERIKNISLNRVSLSKDSGVCTVFFYTPEGLDFFNTALPFLILYKPSLRKALAQSIQSRYTPELVFKFDEKFEKQMRLERLITEACLKDASL